LALDIRQEAIVDDTGGEFIAGYVPVRIAWSIQRLFLPEKMWQQVNHINPHRL
jgi:hypothetical protein